MKRLIAFASAVLVVIALFALSGRELSMTRATLAASEHTPQRTANSTNEIQELIKLVEFFCKNIYPRPSIKECIDRIKHAVGSSADPHSAYYTLEEHMEQMVDREGKFGGLGIEVIKQSNTVSQVVVMGVIDDTPAYKAGLMVGDVITHIGAPITDEHIPTTSLKNIRDAVNLIRGTPGTKATIRVSRKGVQDAILFTIVREEIKIVQVDGGLIVENEKTFAVIRDKSFLMNNASEVEKKFKELKQKAGGHLSGLIVTVESNPGGLLHEAYNLSRLFIDHTEDIVLMRGNERIEQYIPSGRRLFSKFSGDITGGLPMLVVVNGASASASEIFARAMQHHGRAVVAGTSRTYGKGVVQSIEELPDSAGAVKYTSAEYLIGSMDDWVPVQCIGVEPDILFTYPGLKPREYLRECAQNGHVNTGGPMANAPIRPSIKDANAELYKKAEEMLEAYKRYNLPKLLAEEEKRKTLEQQ